MRCMYLHLYVYTLDLYSSNNDLPSFFPACICFDSRGTSSSSILRTWCVWLTWWGYFKYCVQQASHLQARALWFVCWGPESPSGRCKVANLWQPNCLKEDLWEIRSASDAAHAAQPEEDNSWSAPRQTGGGGGVTSTHSPCHAPTRARAHTHTHKHTNVSAWCDIHGSPTWARQRLKPCSSLLGEEYLPACTNPKFKLVVMEGVMYPIRSHPPGQTIHQTNGSSATSEGRANTSKQLALRLDLTRYVQEEFPWGRSLCMPSISNAKGLVDMGVGVRRRSVVSGRGFMQQASSQGIDARTFFQSFRLLSAFAALPPKCCGRRPQSNESYERELLWSHTMWTRFLVHRKLPQSNVKPMLPSNRNHESKKCKKIAVAVLLQPYVGFHCSASPSLNMREGGFPE